LKNGSELTGAPRRGFPTGRENPSSGESNKKKKKRGEEGKPPSHKPRASRKPPLLAKKEGHYKTNNIGLSMGN